MPRWRTAPRPMERDKTPPPVVQEEGEDELDPALSSPVTGGGQLNGHPESHLEDEDRPITKQKTTRKAKMKAIKKLALGDSKAATTSEGDQAGAASMDRPSLVQLPWLQIGASFPWHDANIYLDPSLGGHVQSHLVKRIRKAGGHSTTTASTANIILVNPHPAKLSPGRSGLLSSLENVSNHRAIILSYHWLSRCYFTKVVEPFVLGQPAFLGEDGEGARIAVGKLDGHDADRDRTRIMLDLECNGAVVVDLQECQTCIVTDSHPFLTEPPTEEYVGIQWRSTDWVRQNVMRAKAEEKPVMMVERKTQETPRMKRQAGGQVDRNRVKRSRTIPRTPFTTRDREMLARWLAWKRPLPVGRTTRSIYEELEAYPEDDQHYAWASRHSASAWHEHYKRSRGKQGFDGRILEDMVKSFVARGVEDESLSTARERIKGGFDVNGGKQQIRAQQGRKKNRQINEVALSTARATSLDDAEGSTDQELEHGADAADSSADESGRADSSEVEEAVGEALEKSVE
ncbi:hypothetical protein IAU60_004975 [Kwoniella sp. DSM 27419]